MLLIIGILLFLILLAIIFRDEIRAFIGIVLILLACTWVWNKLGGALKGINIKEFHVVLAHAFAYTLLGALALGAIFVFALIGIALVKFLSSLRPTNNSETKYKSHNDDELQMSPKSEIDQGLKQISTLNRRIADEYGAIAAKWRHVHEDNYIGRPKHEARDGEYFLIRDTWATQKGLVKPGKRPYLDDIDQPGHLPSCRCWAEYIYDLGELPEDMLTRKGRKWS